MCLVRYHHPLHPDNYILHKNRKFNLFSENQFEKGEQHFNHSVGSNRKKLSFPYSSLKYNSILSLFRGVVHYSILRRYKVACEAEDKIRVTGSTIYLQ